MVVTAPVLLIPVKVESEPLINMPCMILLVIFKVAPDDELIIAWFTDAPVAAVGVVAVLDKFAPVNKYPARILFAVAFPTVLLLTV